jgi:O-methyltransferase
MYWDMICGYLKKQKMRIAIKIPAPRGGGNIKPEGNKTAYESIMPYATYAPWLIDNDFVVVYEKIKNNTLVDKYRCFELWQLVKESSKLGGAIIEIGVWRGGTGCLIAKQAEICSVKTTVYLCDTFTGVVKAGKNDSEYKGGEHADTSMGMVKTLINKMHLKNVKILKGVFPDETQEFVKDEKFSFCHVDVDVYQSAKDTVEWIWKRMPIGGIIVFDDYGFSGCNGITKFVDEERYKKDRIIIHNLNGHGIIIKK